MRLWSICLLMCQCLAFGAQAGPWLREKGTSFTSVALTATYFRDFGSTSYIEYGLRDDLTIGADVGTLTYRTGVQSGHATLFARRPLDWGSETSKWAYEVGVGATWKNDIILPHLKTGLSWGRGYELRGKGGWMVVDASVRWAVSEGHHVTKVDSTLGLNFTAATSGMLQLYLTHLEGETYGTIAPSVVFTPKKSKFRIQVGLESPLENTGDTALKIGLWREF